MPMKEYQVVARRRPGDLEGSNPKIYRMKVFAENETHAKSRFWYFLSFLVRMKRTEGEILAVNEIVEKRPKTLKNFGVWLRYNSRSGTHNMYKEVRSLSRCEAINAIYMEMAGMHRARAHSIHIINLATLQPNQVKRPAVKQFLDANIKFPLAHRTMRPSAKQYATTFKASRPRTCY